ISIHQLAGLYFACPPSSSGMGRTMRRVSINSILGRRRMLALPALLAVLTVAALGIAPAFGQCVWNSSFNNPWTSSADWGGTCANTTYPGNGNTDDASIPGGSVNLTVGLSAGNVTINNAGLFISGAPTDTFASLSNQSGGLTEVDFNGAGGSTLTITGTLNNSAPFGNGLYIGNTGITSATTVSAASLVNTGAIEIQGGTAQGQLDVTSSVSSTVSGQFVLNGNALLSLPSGSSGF